LETELWLENGSKLVAKFYTYTGSYQGEVLVENLSPPQLVAENKLVPHPQGEPVEKVTLVLTDEWGNVISTLASFTVTKDDLFARIVGILGYWPEATPAEQDELFAEIVDILGQWPEAP
jgi:hypothetical protein